MTDRACVSAMALAALLLLTEARAEEPVDLPQGVASTREGELTRATCPQPWKLQWDRAGYQTWMYGPNDSITFHLEQFPAPPEAARNIQSQTPLEAPLGWVVRWDAKARQGLWIAADVGPRLTVALRGERVVVDAPAGASVWLGQVTAVEQGWRLCEQCVPAIQWNGLKGSWRDLTIQVDDRNNDGKPDQVADRWHFYRNEKRTLVWSFHTKAQDPRGEGAYCLISTDLNKNGRVDDEEIEHPTYKLVDWNGDGRFLEGNLLQGGRLECDAYYYDLKGCADLDLWPSRVAAYDLDGDGQQDITERLTSLDYLTHGAGGYGTAANQEGLMQNYGHRPFSEVLRIDPATGSVQQKKIGYDQYLFSDNVCSTSAWHIEQSTGIWRPNEEHMEYVGFHPGGEAHLWTWVGGLHRMILGGLGGHGKWKLGVDFDVTLDGLVPERVNTYVTPYGRQLKLVSYLAPEKWDGRKLEGKTPPGGHWDYAEPSPWTWAMSQTVASTATIEPNDEAGEQAFEAYLGGHCDRSRLERSPAGKTSFVFYHSPLMGGLHHKGALYGWRKDSKLLYCDGDSDGVMDTYAWDADNDHRYARRLWYDRRNGQVTLYDHGKLWRWAFPAEFPESHMGLEHFAQLDELYRKGNGDKAVVMGDVPADAAAVPDHKPLSVALDAYHGSAQACTWNSRQAEGGMAFLARALAFSRAELVTVSAAFTAGSLRGVNVLVISHVAKPLEDAETQALVDWTKAGGTLVLAPAEMEPDQLAAFQLLARQAGGDFDEQPIRRDFRKLRIPDQGNIEGDVIGEKYFTALNRITQFSGKPEWLKELNYLSAEGFTVRAPQVDVACGTQALIGRCSVGQGRVLLVGASLLCNRFCLPPLHQYMGQSNDNLILAQRIMAELAGCTPMPYPTWQPDPKPHRADSPIPWKGQTVESDVLKLTVYPELGGRVLWLGRKDTQLNHLRVEEPWYLAGPPLQIGPFAYGRNYGGIWDIGAPLWPGLPFYAQKYETQTLSFPHGQQMVASAEADGIAVRREMYLIQQQSAVRFTTEQRNVSAHPRRSQVRLQAEFTAGPAGIVLYWPSKGKLQRQPYVTGQEEGRGMRDADGGWAAAVDRTHREIVIHRVDKDAKPQLFVWMGGLGGEGDNWSWKEAAPDNWGFYSIQMWMPPRVLPPNDSVKAAVLMQFLRDMDGIDLVGENYVAQLVVPTNSVCAGEEIVIEARLASAGATPELSAALGVVGPQGFAALRRQFEATLAPGPGVPRVHTWKLSTKDWPDGQYTVTIAGPDGQTAQRSFVVNSAGLAAAHASIDAARQAAQGKSAMARAMIVALCEQAAHDLAARDLSAAAARVQRAKAIVPAAP